MASVQSKVLNTILKYANTKSVFDKAFDSGKFDNGNMNEPPRSLFSNLNIQKKQVNGRNVFILKPKNEANKIHILYLHGGGYVFGFNKIHWRFLKTLIHRLNCTVIAPDYPLAPKFTYKDSFEMVFPIYKELIDKMGEGNVIIMGDSSGGGFALALAQKMKLEYNKTNKIILLSPWLDITLENPEIDFIDRDDNILGKNGLIRAGKAYAGDTNPKNYLLSPINGEIEGLGQISIFIGTKDIMEADTRKFKLNALKKGISINYFEYKDMVHDWIFFNLPESKDAIEQIINLINLL